MFSLLKSVFGRKETSEDVSKSSSRPEASTQPETGTNAPPPDSTGADVIELPLKTVVNCLPQPLQSQLQKAPLRQTHLVLPIKSALAQLPKGSVKLTFKEIKALAPSGTFLSTTAHDNTLVELPLPEIVARLKPELMPRRSGQRRVEVPDEVAPIFGPTGSVNGAVRIAAAPAGPLAPAPLPASNRAISPQNGALPFHKNGAPQPPRSEASTPASESMAAPSLVPIPTESSSASRTPAQTNIRPGSKEILAVQINQVGTHWPETLRAALARLAVEDTTMHIPLAEIEPALKRGKIDFTWKQLRSWVVPTPAGWFPEHDSLRLELPLSAIAPLFMNRRRDLEGRSKSFVPPEIPDVFSPFAQTGLTERSTIPNPPSSSRLPRPSPSAPLAQESIVLPKSVLPTPPVNGTAASDKTDLSASVPAAIVEHARRLPGVSGALIATHDGLTVAAQLSEQFSAEAISAFLPQMHNRLTQYTREMKIGEPSQLVIVADGRPLAIFKGHDTYLAVLGTTGECLPEAPIKALALRLQQPTPNA